MTEMPCAFCEEHAGKSVPDLTRLYGSSFPGRTVWAGADLALMPSLGQLAPLHLLLVPTDHSPSFGQLATAVRDEAQDVVNRIHGHLSGRSRALVIFEHGMADHSCPAAGCGISHAHMHLLSSYRFSGWTETPTDPGFSWRRLSDDAFISALPSDGDYLFYAGPAGAQVTGVHSLPSQFMRRWLAGRVDIPAWDWRLATQREDLPGTAARLRAELRAALGVHSVAA